MEIAVRILFLIVSFRKTKVVVYSSCGVDPHFISSRPISLVVNNWGENLCP